MEVVARVARVRDTNPLVFHTGQRVQLKGERRVALTAVITQGECSRLHSTLSIMTSTYTLHLITSDMYR